MSFNNLLYFKMSSWYFSKSSASCATIFLILSTIAVSSVSSNMCSTFNLLIISLLLFKVGETAIT